MGYSRHHRIVSLLTIATFMAALAVVVAPPVLGVAASQAYNAGPHPLAQPATVLQSLPASCGPAVLATLTGWFGAPRTEAELLAAANLGPNGVTLSEFARLANLVGLPGTWYSVPMQQLASVPAPFVAHLNVEAGFGRAVLGAPDTGGFVANRSVSSGYGSNGSGSGGLGHLVAVAAYAYGYVVVADPAGGTYVLSAAQFARSFSGRVFVLDGAS